MNGDVDRCPNHQIDFTSTTPTRGYDKLYCGKGILYSNPLHSSEDLTCLGEQQCTCLFRVMSFHLCKGSAIETWANDFEERNALWHNQRRKLLGLYRWM